MKQTPMPPRKAPLARRAGLVARTPLATVTPLRAAGTLARSGPLKPVSKKRARENRERRAMLAAKYPERPLCAVPWCFRWADDAHEPLTRARGGAITDAANVEALCRPCHDVITFEEPEWAYELGLLVHSWAPAQHGGGKLAAKNFRGGDAA